MTLFPRSSKDFQGQNDSNQIDSYMQGQIGGRVDCVICVTTLNKSSTPRTFFVLQIFSIHLKTERKINFHLEELISPVPLPAVALIHQTR